MSDEKKAEQPIDEYIVSYIALPHFIHALLGISKKVEKNYYLVNSIGLLDVSAGRNLSGANSEGRIPQPEAVQELIHPKKEKCYVYAKHFVIHKEKADPLLNFINFLHGKGLMMDFINGKNCHNLPIALLQTVGIANTTLHDSSNPVRKNDMCHEIERVPVPKTLPKPEFKFYQYNLGTGRYETAKPSLITVKNTWQWQENIKLESELSYQPKVEYFRVLAKTPNLLKTDSPETKNTKRAIYLLKNYADDSYSSLFWHPFRNYRTAVKNVLQNFKMEEGVSGLLNKVRKAILDYHRKNGDVPNAKGSLNERLLFIDFMLNQKTKTFEQLQKTYQPKDPTYSDLMHTRKFAGLF